MLDESRAWSEWARWLGVSDLTLAGLLGAAIARGQAHVEALRAVKPGVDFAAERRARARAGNTAAAVEGFLRTACGLQVVASSTGLGTAKPAPGFFAATASLAELPALLAASRVVGA